MYKLYIVVVVLSPYVLHSVHREHVLVFLVLGLREQICDFFSIL